MSLSERETEAPQSSVHCPSCSKEMRSLRDYPLVKVSALELVPLPEKVMGGLHRSVDFTEPVIKVFQEPEMQEYLESLTTLVDQTVGTETLLPPFAKDRFFKNFYSIPYSEGRLFIGMHDLKDENDEPVRTPLGSTATIELWTHGPNFGSAGGPTLMALTDIATITYQGTFLPSSQ